MDFVARGQSQTTVTVTASLLSLPCLQLCFHVCRGWTWRQHQQTLHESQPVRVVLPTHVLVLAFCWYVRVCVWVAAQHSCSSLSTIHSTLYTSVLLLTQRTHRQCCKTSHFTIASSEFSSRRLKWTHIHSSKFCILYKLTVPKKELVPVLCLSTSVSGGRTFTQTLYSEVNIALFPPLHLSLLTALVIGCFRWRMKDEVFL